MLEWFDVKSVNFTPNRSDTWIEIHRHPNKTLIESCHDFASQEMAFPQAVFIRVKQNLQGV